MLSQPPKKYSPTSTPQQKNSLKNIFEAETTELIRFSILRKLHIDNGMVLGYFTLRFRPWDVSIPF